MSDRSRMTSSTAVSEDEDASYFPTKPQITPLPNVQLGVVLALFLAEPITSTVIYPFINELLNDFGITHGDPRKTGYYVGFMESIFFFAEALFILQWGRLSDKIGRKPVLLVSVFGLALSMVSFGLSRTFWPLVVSRAVAGALNATGVVKSVLGEITDDSNMSQAFAFLPICWAGGSTIGPFLGGIGSHPSERWPRVFSSPFWKTYPYFLPCLATALYSLFAFFLVFFLLRETLTPKANRTTRLISASVVDTPGPETPLLSSSSPEQSQSLFSVVTPRVQGAILNYSLLSLLDITFVALQPLILSTPIEAGGLGLPPATIGVVLGSFGLLDGLIGITCFAWMCRTIGTRRLFAISIASFGGAIAAFPIMNWIARRQGLTPLVWVVMGVQFAIIVLDGMAFACISMFVTASAPTRNSLGSVNGLAQTATSIMRTIGPAATTSFFTLSVEKNLVGGNLAYLVLILLTAVAFAAARLLPEEPWPRTMIEQADSIIEQNP